MLKKIEIKVKSSHIQILYVAILDILDLNLFAMLLQVGQFKRPNDLGDLHKVCHRKRAFF